MNLRLTTEELGGFIVDQSFCVLGARGQRQEEKKKDRRNEEGYYIFEERPTGISVDG